jgi:PAS domain S-box-containing protein
VRSLPGLRSIRARLVFAFSTLVAAIAVFTFIFFPARLERQAMRATIAKATAVRDMLAYCVEPALVFDDSIAVNEALVGATRVPDVAYLVVWDNARKIRGAYGTPARTSFPDAATSAESSDRRTFVSAAPVLHGGAVVGAVAVGVSLEPLHAELAGARSVGALVSALILGIGILAIFAISTLVTRSLTDVSRTVGRIAAGDLSIRAAETGGAEVDRLVRGFNGMVDSLVGTQAELARINEDLEARVAVRTSELTQAVEEQRRSQNALMVSELRARRNSELQQSLIDVAPQAIIAVDLDWRVTRWNRAAERMFGWCADEVLGRALPYIPLDCADEFRTAQTQLMTGEPYTGVEKDRMRKDGSRITVLLAAAVLRDHEQQVIGYIAFAIDLTERKRLEEQLRQSQKMEAMGRLAGGVAHDFNNILTVISAYTDLLLIEETSDEKRDHLEQVSGAATRAAALTKQLLTFTRQQIVRVRDVELASVVGEMEPMLRRVLPANIRFTVLADPSAGTVSADPTQIEQVLMNLVVNASDAMPEGGSLIVETRCVELRDSRSTQTKVPPGMYALLSVRDTGVGMTEATIRRIFEPFFTTKEVGKGTGLGLATTYAVVTDLGGTIDVHSRIGHGTTFEIYLPHVHAPAVAPTPASPSGAQASPEQRLRGPVLLVEDEDAVRRVVKRTLERSGYRVFEARDGEAGLSLAAEQRDHIDAVVTDMMMPGMDGGTFAAKLALRYPQLGVVYISGYTAASVGAESIVDARHVFLQKPFSPSQLVDAIESVSAVAAEA